MNKKLYKQEKQDITLKEIKEQQEKWYRNFTEIFCRKKEKSILCEQEYLDYQISEVCEKSQEYEFSKSNKHDKINKLDKFDKIDKLNEDNTFNNFNKINSLTNINKFNTMAFQPVIENKKEATNIINEVLKILNENQLKNEEIKIVKNNYTSLKNLDGEACVLFQNVKFENIYYLIHIINKIDYKMPLNIIECYYQNVRRLLKEKENSNKIPLIIPCIIYIGKEDWKAKRSIEEEENNFKCFEIPEKKMNLGKYILIETNKIKDEKLVEMKGIFPKLLVVERTKKFENLMKIVNVIDSLELKKEDKNLINEYLYYKLCESCGKRSADIKIKRIKEVEKNLNFVDIINMQIYKEKKKAKIEERNLIEQRMRENGINENMIKKIVGEKG